MATANPLPPDSNGLPLLGETLAFANNPFAFIHERHARFGDVFRTGILGKPTVFLSLKWVVPPEHKNGLVVRWSRLDGPPRTS